LDKPLEIWWQDEARVGQQGTLTRLWVERGSRPTAPKDLRYEWAYLFGAVCPARGTWRALLLPHANADMMNLLERPPNRPDRRRNREGLGVSLGVRLCRSPSSASDSGLLPVWWTPG
jgi:hypothetical protein